MCQQMWVEYGDLWEPKMVSSHFNVIVIVDDIIINTIVLLW